MVGILLQIVLVVSLFFVTACASAQASLNSQAKAVPPELPISTPTPKSSEPSPTSSPSPTPTRTAVPSPVPTATPRAIASPASSGATASGPVAPLIVRGNTHKPFVSLTFDSGAAAGSTAEILDILRDNKIRTTFFITGQWAEKNPSLVKRMVTEGHTIANHSYSHPDMTKVGDETIASELSRTEEIVKRIAGVTTKPYFRPPFGAYDNRVLRVLASQGYKAVYWTLDSTDWRDDSTVESVTRRVVNNVEAGSIVVHHSSPEKTAKALPSIIRQVRAKGLEIVNLPELLGE